MSVPNPNALGAWGAANGHLSTTSTANRKVLRFQEAENDLKERQQASEEARQKIKKAVSPAKRATPPPRAPVSPAPQPQAAPAPTPSPRRASAAGLSAVGLLLDF